MVELNLEDMVLEALTNKDRIVYIRLSVRGVMVDCRVDLLKDESVVFNDKPSGSIRGFSDIKEWAEWLLNTYYKYLETLSEDATKEELLARYRVAKRAASQFGTVVMETCVSNAAFRRSKEVNQESV